MSATEDLGILEDLETLARQDAVLRFPEFGPGTAWRLGNLLRDELLARKAGGSVEIELGGHLLFACATPGAKPSQADWIRRKRNTVHHFQRSSYAIGRELERDHTTLEAAHHLSETGFAAHGGGFPLWLAGTGCVGSIVLSGLPQRDDHNVVVTAVAEVLHVAIPHLRAEGPQAA